MMRRPATYFDSSLQLQTFGLLTVCWSLCLAHCINQTYGAKIHATPLPGVHVQGGVSSISPIAFRAKLTKFAPQFQGYAQQDGQELLAFLLDGLHEDLNRILDKPYLEDKEAPGRSDAQMAAEAWASYRKRNDSVIVDHLQVSWQEVRKARDILR